MSQQRKADPFAQAFNAGPQLYWTGVQKGTPPPPGMAGVVAMAAVEVKTNERRGRGGGAPSYPPASFPGPESQWGAPTGHRSRGGPSAMESGHFPVPSGHKEMYGSGRTASHTYGGYGARADVYGGAAEIYDYSGQGLAPRMDRHLSMRPSTAGKAPVGSRSLKGTGTRAYGHEPERMPAFASHPKVAKIYANAAAQMAAEEEVEEEEPAKPRRKADPFAEPYNSGGQIFWQGVKKGEKPAPGMAGIIAMAAVEVTDGKKVSSRHNGVVIPDHPAMSRPKTAHVTHGASRVLLADRYKSKPKSKFGW